ncbi:MAG: MFS transporter, partial [Parachlamydiaceae bacterium]|nr:MFS transporter [Parachlamydiaceae bacterium]
EKRGLSTIKKALFIGVFLSIFQQITGINAVIYYASTIFQMSGYATASSATLASIGVGLVNVIATIFSIRLLDQKGRRWLLLIGTAGMDFTLSFLALAFWTHWSFIEILSPISLMAYVIFFAIGLGPVTWVVISEIFPLELRGKAMAIATFANWFCNYIVALTFLDLINTFGKGETFALYAVVSLIAFIFIYKYIPETKGKSLDEIQNSFNN